MLHLASAGVPCPAARAHLGTLGRQRPALSRRFCVHPLRRSCRFGSRCGRARAGQAFPAGCRAPPGSPGSLARRGKVAHLDCLLRTHSSRPSGVSLATPRHPILSRYPTKGARRVLHANVGTGQIEVNGLESPSSPLRRPRDAPEVNRSEVSRGSAIAASGRAPVSGKGRRRNIRLWVARRSPGARSRQRRRAAPRVPDRRQRSRLTASRP